LSRTSHASFAFSLTRCDEGVETRTRLSTIIPARFRKKRAIYGSSRTFNQRRIVTIVAFTGISRTTDAGLAWRAEFPGSGNTAVEVGAGDFASDRFGVLVARVTGLGVRTGNQGETAGSSFAGTSHAIRCSWICAIRRSSAAIYSASVASGWGDVTRLKRTVNSG